jgi:hypothetical protein
VTLVAGECSPGACREPGAGDRRDGRNYLTGAFTP